ncbi:hypothetical protein F4776DRAFT_36099 [Hypoxylon sp. NC0597]|nr:hypothetical protein F4776DRAFT_36099 [Hypoxylon sp. NC0597]
MSDTTSQGGNPTDTTAQEGSPTGSKSPVARSPDTECTIQLGAGLLPASIGGTKKCKCIIVETPEELERLVVSINKAVKMGILNLHKPSTAFAVLILGGHLDYPKKDE